MTSKLQKAVEVKKHKHVPSPEGSLWLDKTVYPKSDASLQELRNFTGLLYSGMIDLKKWLEGLEEFLNIDEKHPALIDVVMKMKQLEDQQSAQNKSIVQLSKELHEALSEE